MSKQLEIVIPTELREITLSKYLALRDFMEGNTNDVEVSIKLIALMCDMSVRDVRGLRIEDFNGIVTQLTETLNKKTNYVKPPNFKLNDVEYGFIPNLDEMTFGEYIDLDTFIKDEKDYNKVMTILFRPITHKSFSKYSIAEYTGEEDWSIMLDAPMDAVNSAIIFFYTLGKDLLKVMENSLAEEMTEGTSASKQILEKSGVGTRASMDLLTETLENSMKLPVFKFTKR